MTPKSRVYIEKRLRHLEKVKAIVAGAFEVAPPAFCIRRTDVGLEVARSMGVPLSPKVLRDVHIIAPSLGFVAVKNQQRRLYANCKYRNEDPIAALERSRRNRHDVRDDKP